MNQRLYILVALITITACAHPAAQEIRGERNIAYKTAWFNNTPYHLVHDDTTLTYNVSVLSETNYDDAAPNATIQGNTLIIDVINAGGHPGVKPAYYTTPLTGTISTNTAPDTLRITDNASLNNKTIQLDWQSTSTRPSH